MRILVADGRRGWAESIAEELRREFSVVDVRYDGLEADRLLSLNSYDVAVLDRELPGMSGDEVCAGVVASGVRTRVLMLTVSPVERLSVLTVGADEWLSRESEFSELVAKISELGSRTRRPLPTVLTAADVVLDPIRHVASRAGRPLALSPREFAVLEVMLRSQGSVVSPEEVLAKVWGQDEDHSSGTVRVVMSRLRVKLGMPPVVHTVPGSGYRI
jgi:DNA-binding response OmpR family regulator